MLRQLTTPLPGTPSRCSRWERSTHDDVPRPGLKTLLPRVLDIHVIAWAFLLDGLTAGVSGPFQHPFREFREQLVSLHFLGLVLP